ncbi:cyclin-dependent kinase 20 isoform X2 [Calonectris borealis]|uniref:cyclin-dependent kinase 20 isoform X2 n=1 Tax=Calonectris borealis TaxID=1323832 RepID=UPI003F4C12E7
MPRSLPPRLPPAPPVWTSTSYWAALGRGPTASSSRPRTGRRNSGPEEGAPAPAGRGGAPPNPAGDQSPAGDRGAPPRGPAPRRLRPGSRHRPGLRFPGGRFGGAPAGGPRPPAPPPRPGPAGHDPAGFGPLSPPAHPAPGPEAGQPAAGRDGAPQAGGFRAGPRAGHPPGTALQPPSGHQVVSSTRAPLRRPALRRGGRSVSDIEQLCCVLRALGTPSPAAWPELAELPDYPKIRFRRQAPAPLEQLVPEAGPLARDLLRRFLRYPSRQRLRAHQALLHPYFFGPLELTPPPPQGGPRPPPEFNLDAPLLPALPPPGTLGPSPAPGDPR